MHLTLGSLRHLHNDSDAPAEKRYQGYKVW